MASDATGSNGSREAALHRALAAHREAYKTKVATIETDLASGQMTAAQAREAMRTARAIYTRDCDLAEIAAVTGWHTWVGVGGVLYAPVAEVQPAAGGPGALGAGAPRGDRGQQRQCPVKSRHPRELRIIPAQPGSGPHSS